MKTLELAILEQIKCSLADSISKTLTNQWSSPVGEMIREVFSEHSWELKSILSETISDFIRTDEFKKSLKEEFNHKLAKNCVSLLESQVDKALLVVKNDQMLRAKMVVALENIIKENI